MDTASEIMTEDEFLALPDDPEVDRELIAGELRERRSTTRSDHMATVSKLMTEKEFLALPDDSEIDRELIEGELRERAVTTRGCAHTVVSSNIGYHLMSWQRLQPPPRGWVMTGDARIRLATDPSTFVGADFAYVAPAVRPKGGRKAKFVDGPPSLVIEILSPTDEAEDIADKIERYLAAGVPLVWIVDPRLSTVIVHRPDARPRLFNLDEELTAETHLPGFRVAVAEVFADLDA